MEFWKENLKKFRLPGFKPWPLQYWCSALTNLQASKPTGSWSLNQSIIYPGKIIVMIFSVFTSSSCSSNIWNSYIYRFKKLIINITQDQKIHLWLSPQRKQQHNSDDSNLVQSKSQGRPMQGSESRQRSVTDFPLLLNSKWPNVSRLALITRKTHNTAYNNRNCDWLIHWQHGL